MTENKQENNDVVRFGKAWIVRWGFHGENEDRSLERYGIKNKIIDIFNTRKDFDAMSEKVKNLYRIKMFSFSEKAFLENYKYSRKNEKEIFGHSVPVFTSYQSDLYRNMMNALSLQGSKDIEYKNLLEKWKNYPEYIIVGHNPYLEAKKVFSLRIVDNNGIEKIEFEEPLVDGSSKNVSYRINNEY